MELPSTPGYYFVQQSRSEDLSDLVILWSILQQITLLDLRNITNISLLTRLHNLMENDPVRFPVLEESK